MKRRKLKLIIIAFIVSYTCWIIFPHISGVTVTNHAKLSDKDIVELVSLLKNEDFLFSGKGDPGVIVSSFVNPLSRPKFFATFHGGTDHVSIKAGFIRGPLWGGGQIMSARKIDGKWELEPSNIRWIS